MSNDKTNPSDATSNTVRESSIGLDAEREIWLQIRTDIRRRLITSITIGLLYLLGALVVGGFLIHTIGEIGRDTVYLQGWEPHTLNLQWMTNLMWCYFGFGVLASLGYVGILLMIRNYLPSVLWRFGSSIPWIGSTVRMIELGDLCQSIYRSVLRSLPYDEAFSKAASEVQSAGLKAWSARVAEQIRSGQSLTRVLRSCPAQDQPLAAVAAITQGELSTEDCVNVWHQATVECHALALSRLNRATQVISVTCLLCSVGLAAFALVASARFMAALLEGLT